MIDRPCAFLDQRLVARCTECGTGLALCLCPDPSSQADARLRSNAGRHVSQVWRELSQWQGPKDHLFERLVRSLGELGEKLVSNMDTGTPAESEIQRDLVRLGVLLTLLAAYGTPEYSYPAT